MQIYYYPGCSTCRKALKWLAAHDLDVTKTDLVAETPDAARLRELWETSGQPLRRFFNTSGQSYRNGGFKDRMKTLSDDDKLTALAADGMLIKRPLLVTDDTVLIGFKPDAWAAALGVEA